MYAAPSRAELACAALRVVRCVAHCDPTATALLLRSGTGVRDGSCRVKRPPKSRCRNCMHTRVPRVDTPYCHGCRQSIDPEICKTVARFFCVPECALAALSPRRRRGGSLNYPIASLIAYCREHTAECVKEVGRRRSVQNRERGERFVQLSLGATALEMLKKELGENLQ